MPKAKPESQPILNPRYAGATPEDVGRALLKHPPKDEKPAEREPAPVQSSI